MTRAAVSTAASTERLEESAGLAMTGRARVGIQASVTKSRAAASDRTALFFAILAYLGGGASAVHVPLGVIGVPVALLFGALAIRRAGERRQWAPVGLAALGGIFTLLWFGLMMVETGLLGEYICPAACAK